MKPKYQSEANAHRSLPNGVCAVLELSINIEKWPVLLALGGRLTLTYLRDKAMHTA